MQLFIGISRNRIWCHWLSVSGIAKMLHVGYSLICPIYKWPWLKWGMFYIYHTCIFSDTWPHVLTVGWRHVSKYMRSYSVGSTSLYARSNQTFPAISSEGSGSLHQVTSLLWGSIWNTLYFFLFYLHSREITTMNNRTCWLRLYISTTWKYTCWILVWSPTMVATIIICLFYPGTVPNRFCN